MSARCAVCRLDDGLVVNVIMADPSDPAPDGCRLVGVMEGDYLDIGWIWAEDQGFHPPAESGGGN